MKRSLKLLSCLTLTSLFSATAATAQIRYCVAGDLSQMKPAEKAACSAQLQTVRQAAAAFHAPQDWHFVLVCGENGWKDYSAYATGNGSALDGVYADTNAGNHETFLRASLSGDQMDATLQRTIAHEVASVLLNSKDEAAIQKQVALWISNSPTPSGM